MSFRGSPGRRLWNDRHCPLRRALRAHGADRDDAGRCPGHGHRHGADHGAGHGTDDGAGARPGGRRRDERAGRAAGLLVADRRADSFRSSQRCAAIRPRGAARDDRQPRRKGGRLDDPHGRRTPAPPRGGRRAGRVLAPPAVPIDTPLPGQGAEDHGSGWANLAVPAAPIGLDKATIDARVDPAADQGRLATALSRSLPIGGGFSLTLQNGYAVTQTLANPNGMATAPNPRIYTGDGGVKLDLPTQTAVSARASMSSSADRPTPSRSAEQKLFDTPLSITGTISQRPTGETDRSIMAGFKQTW